MNSPARSGTTRLPGLDVTRAVALIGVAIMNYHGYLNADAGTGGPGRSFAEHVFDNFARALIALEGSLEIAAEKYIRSGHGSLVVQFDERRLVARNVFRRAYLDGFCLQSRRKDRTGDAEGAARESQALPQLPLGEEVFVRLLRRFPERLTAGQNQQMSGAPGHDPLNPGLTAFTEISLIDRVANQSNAASRERRAHAPHHRLVGFAPSAADEHVARFRRFRHGRREGEQKLARERQIDLLVANVSPADAGERRESRRRVEIGFGA